MAMIVPPALVALLHGAPRKRELFDRRPEDQLTAIEGGKAIDRRDREALVDIGIGRIGHNRTGARERRQHVAAIP